MGRLLAMLCLALLALPAVAGARERDRDRDRLPDRWERKHGLSPKKPNGAADNDGDGAANRAEYRARSHPRRRDTDRDRLSDGFELKLSGTSPRRRDTDRDRTPDGAEDADGDSLSHSRERGLHTHPRRADTDRDGLADGRELALRTDPLDFDTDGDGWRDAREIALGSGPRDAGSRPKRPETTIVAYPGALVASRRASFRFRASAPARYQCSVDSGGWRACAADTAVTLPDGAHRLAVRAVNAEGWVDDTPASYRWTSDTLRPVVSISSAPSEWLRSTTGVFRFSATEAGVAFECRLDAGIWRACSSPSTNRSLSQGAHGFSVRARDRAGNLSAAVPAAPFTVDTLAPDTTITSVPASPATGPVTFTFTGTEAGSFRCSIDGGSYSACAPPVTLTGLSLGFHTFRVRALDQAGNRDGSPSRATFRISR